MLICEMTAYYKTQGKTLLDVLNGIYEKYGYYYTEQKSFTCEGQSGMEKIKGIMASLRENAPSEIDGSKVIKINDYGESVSINAVSGEKTVLTLPKSNVLCYFLENGSSFIVRPSGTEPKIKIYICAVGSSAADGEQRKQSLVAAGTKLLGF